MSLLKWIPSRGRLPASPPWTPDQVPVVFLHGTLGSPGNFERPAKALAAQGRPFFAPAYGQHGTGALENSVTELLAYFRDLETLGVQEVDIVGHSAGGLMGLRIAHEYPHLVRRLVGLGAAFRGTPRQLVLKPIIQWIAGDAFIDLARGLEAEEPAGVELVSVYSTADLVVPASSSMLGYTIKIEGVRHENLPRATEVILDALTRPMPT